MGGKALETPVRAITMSCPCSRGSETNRHFRDGFHRQEGPLSVELAVSTDGALSPALVASAESLGFKNRPNWDFNGGTQEDGVGFYQHTVKNGKRHSSAAAFLAPFLSRENLKARPWSLTTRVLADKGRVTGVEYVSNDWEVHIARARREVIVCAGTIDSPQLLLLSGIGPEDELRKHGIPVLHHLPGVGRNFQDHPAVGAEFETDRAQLGDRAGAAHTVGLFTRTAACPATDSPDMQLFAWETLSRGAGPGDAGTKDSASFWLAAFSATASSRGRISLRSADPLRPPVIQGNFLQRQRDVAALIAFYALPRELANTRPLAGLLTGELRPGKSRRSRRDLEEFARQHMVRRHSSGRDL